MGGADGAGLAMYLGGGRGEEFRDQSIPLVSSPEKQN